MTAVFEQFKGTPSTQTSKSFTFDSSVKVGSLLVAVVRWAYSSNSETPTVSDDVNGSWTLIDSINCLTGTSFPDLLIYEYLNSAAGTITVSITHGDIADRFRIGGAEFSGVAGFTRLDKSIQGNNSDTCSSGAITVPSGYDALAVGMSISDNNTTFTPNSPFSEAGEAGDRCHIQYKVEPTAGSLQSAPTFGATEENGGSIVLYGVAGSKITRRVIVRMGL